MTRHVMRREKVGSPLGLVLVCLILISCGGSESGPDTDGMEASGPWAEGAVKATDWLKEYAVDIKAADKKYVGTIMTVVGVVEDAGVSVFDNPYLALRGIPHKSGAPLNVVCYFEPELTKKIIKVKRGSTVYVRGECSFFEANFPSLENSELLHVE